MADGDAAKGSELAALERRHAALQRKLEKVVAISDLYEEQLRAARRDLRQLQDLFLPICMFCKRVRSDDAYWERIERYFSRQAAVTFSHGICPSCMDERFGGADGRAALAPAVAAPPDPPGRQGERHAAGREDDPALDRLRALVEDPRLEGSPLAPALRDAVERCARSVARYRKVVEISDGYQEEHQARLERALAHDPLTGLASRPAAIQAIEEACDRGRHGGEAPVLVLLELDGLREVNAEHGFEVGDRVLVALSRALRTSAPRARLRARWHGTAFALLLEAREVPATADAALASLRSTAVAHGPLEVKVRVRMGLAAGERRGSTAAWIARAEAEAAHARSAPPGDGE